MQFVFQPLVWGFLLVLVPLLIHLINLLRHRRQQWAAMEFLLESYKKNKRWVWLKQALLLATRMLIVAVAVAMLAQWISGARFLSLFGQQVVHHYVLLDDSMSMADSSQGVSAYQKGLSAIGSILQGAADDEAYHQVTLIRFSRAEMASAKNVNRTAGDSPANDPDGPGIPSDAANSGESNNSTSEGDPNATPSAESGRADLAADHLARSIPADPSPLMERLNTTSPVPMEVTGQAAIDMARAVIERSSGEQSIVYLVSDFRKKDWTNPANVRASLESIDNDDFRVEMVDCALNQNQNLTLTSIRPEQEVLAAGVPAFVKIQIRNNGANVARNVQIRVRAIDYGNATSAKPEQEFSGDIIELPPIVIDELPPGETTSRRAQVIFQKPGSHVVTANLPADSLRFDNSVSCVLDINAGQRVLLVDGDPNQSNAYLIESAIAPGNSAKTGLLVERGVPESLRDAQVSDLMKYQSIFLLAVDRLDPRAIQTLEEFVAAGGGVCIFPGANFGDAEITQYNDLWYRDGTGLMPAKLSAVIDLPEADEANSVDLIPQPHPIVEPLLGLSDSPFRSVRLTRFVGIDQRETPETDRAMESDLDAGSSANLETNQPITTPMRIVATTRTQQPLIVEHGLGAGRVVFYGTALDRRWTNLFQDPTFVVLALKTSGYLGSFRQLEFAQRVGDPVLLTSSTREIVPTVDVLLPKPTNSPARTQLELVAQPLFVANDESAINQDAADLSKIRAELDLNPTDRTEETVQAILEPGVVEMWATRLDGGRFVSNVAQNAAPSEGDMAVLPSQQLTTAMQPMAVKYRTAESLEKTTLAASMASRNMFLLLLLVGLLLFEQILAWKCSYHALASRVKPGVAA